MRRSMVAGIATVKTVQRTAYYPVFQMPCGTSGTSGNLVGVAEIAWDRQAPVGNIQGPELSKLYILEWFAGRGIGWHLLAAAEQVALAKGHKLMWLWVLDTNQRAVDFYQRQQYKIIGNAPFRMEVNSYDNHVMVKDLSVHPPSPIELI